uniref:Uncharacterized protein n=1 Tax=Euglena viridis TaxID=3040 RepID=M1ETR9_EUGVI|nr:hypothetical protein I642_p058 [Euglena viridis]AEY70787.1 hypothetical protein [Euglena viridis]
MNLFQNSVNSEKKYVEKYIPKQSQNWFGVIFCNNNYLSSKNYCDFLYFLRNNKLRLNFFMLVILNINGSLVMLINLEYNINYRKNIINKNLFEGLSNISSEANIFVYIRCKFHENCQKIPSENLINISRSRNAIMFLASFQNTSSLVLGPTYWGISRMSYNKVSKPEQQSFITEIPGLDKCLNNDFPSEWSPNWNSLNINAQSKKTELNLFIKDSIITIKLGELKKFNIENEESNFIDKNEGKKLIKPVEEEKNINTNIKILNFYENKEINKLIKKVLKFFNGKNLEKTVNDCTFIFVIYKIYYYNNNRLIWKKHYTEKEKEVNSIQNAPVYELLQDIGIFIKEVNLGNGGNQTKIKLIYNEKIYNAILKFNLESFQRAIKRRIGRISLELKIDRSNIEKITLKNLNFEIEE